MSSAPDLLFVLDHGYQVKYYRDVYQLATALIDYHDSTNLTVHTYRKVDDGNASTLDLNAVRDLIKKRQPGQVKLEKAVAKSDGLTYGKFDLNRILNLRKPWPSETDGTAKAVKKYKIETRKMVEKLIPR